MNLTRPEHIAGIGYYIQHLRQTARANLLTNIYLMIIDHLSDPEQIAFYTFYQEMLLGMDLQAREAGAQPKSTEDLAKFINALLIDDSLKRICDSLITLMDPPEPLEM